MVMVNKFANIEHKINALVNLLPELPLDQDKMDANMRKFIEGLNQTEIKF
jgi:hypothetical protein